MTPSCLGGSLNQFPFGACCGASSIGSFLRGVRPLSCAILAPPVSFWRRAQPNAVVVGDLGAALAAHHVATILALVAVIVPLEILVVGHSCSSTFALACHQLALIRIHHLVSLRFDLIGRALLNFVIVFIVIITDLVSVTLLLNGTGTSAPTTAWLDSTAFFLYNFFSLFL